MTRSQRRSGRARRASAGAARRRNRPARSLWRRSALLLLALTPLAIVGLWRKRAAQYWARPLPALPRPTSRPRVAFDLADFAGPEPCAECHPRQYAAWRRSVHATAGGSIDSLPVLPTLTGTTMRFADAQATVEKRQGRPAFVVRHGDLPEVALRPVAVIGGGHMEGGGTQGFLARFPDGTYRFLPFDYSRQGRTWFCNTIGRTDRGWVPITSTLRLSECTDWPPARVLGDIPRFNNCQGCHGSQVTAALDSTKGGYATRFTSLSITCESCHGPAGRHLVSVRDSSALARGELAMQPLGTLSKDASLGVCFGCHALKDRIRSGYLSGLPVEDYYSLRLPQLGDAAHHPDGRIRTFGYQEGHLWSDCYVNGGMTCTSCHDPHSQGYRDQWGRSLAGRFDDAQCTACHASKELDIESHTHHAVGSAGSACVSCHMPYLQQPELGDAIPYKRSDHSIAVPRPGLDSALGIRSACRTCHVERSETALDSVVRAWYGPLKPRARAVAALIEARSVRDAVSAARLVLVPGERHRAALYAGLAWFVETWLEPDARLEREVARRLRGLAQDADIDIAALALAALHYARGTDAAAHRFLAQQLAAAGEREDALRGRWALALGYLADRLRDRGKVEAAIATYQKAAEVDPANPAILVNMGLAEAQRGNFAAATTAYESALALDRFQPLVWVNLGIARADRGDLAGAMQAYRSALELDPREPLAHFNLGGLWARLGRPDSALASFQRAAVLDPSLYMARFYSARFLLEQGRRSEALREIDAGLLFDPTNNEALRMRDLLRQEGKR